MKYVIKIEKPVIKFLKKHTTVASRFLQKIALMERDPQHDLLDIKKLTGTTDRYRLRIGKYRFLYRIDHDQIVIYFFDADGRGDVYK